MESCSACKFYLDSRTEGSSGPCRRYAPSRHGGAFVFREDWCGEYEKGEPELTPFEEIKEVLIRDSKEHDVIRGYTVETSGHKYTITSIDEKYVNLIEENALWPAGVAVQIAFSKE